MIGERVAGHIITGLLGHGSQGTVYEAHDDSGRVVALKLLLPQLVRDSFRVERFFEEARAASSIRHNGVVTVFDHGRDDAGRVYLVMERLFGETLFQRLHRATLEIAEALFILRALSAALSAVHEAPSAIVHRDLKPENVFLAADPDGSCARVVLMDFGIAKLASASAGTWSGAGAFGTPPYMSPEQWSGDGVIDERTDIYALACLLHEMLTGTPPFGFGPPMELARAHRDDEPPPLSECTVDVPAALVELERAMLSKRPADRPRSCRAVVSAIDALALPLHLTAHTTATPVATLPLSVSVTPPQSLRERAWAHALESPPWAPGAVACAVGSLLLGVTIISGVGDSFLAMPNWGLTYVALVPLLVMLLVGGVQQGNRAIERLIEQGRIASDERARVRASLRRIGTGLVTLFVVLSPLSVAISVLEWRSRRPLPGEWWSDSAVAGAAGASCQGVLSVVIIVFAVFSVAWTHLVSTALTARRAGANFTLAAEELAPLEDPLLRLLAAGAIVHVILYLSSWQAVAARNGGFAAVLFPKRWSDELLVPGDGHYAAGVVIVSSAMLFVFLSLSISSLRAAWPTRRVTAASMLVASAACVIATSWLWLSLPALVVLCVVVARAMRA